MLPRFAGAFNETTLIEGRCELVEDVMTTLIEEKNRQIADYRGLLELANARNDLLQKEIDDLMQLLKYPDLFNEWRESRNPRVLEYDELFKEETFSLWYEDKEHLLLLHVACVDGEYEDMHVNVAVEDSYENWSTYGKTWRMWNAIPTDKQRKAVPWKDGDGE